ncbi:MAG: EamA family transporter [Lachnospiraceae bacterium]|nr:EamA family transporter [Lachnospiraceae bacterium]
MKKLAPIFILLAGALWGSMGIFVRRYNSHDMSSMEIVALRAVVTVVMMFVFLMIYNRKLLKIRLKDIWCFIGTGLLSIIFFNFCYFKAITMTSLSVAAVLLYTAPAIVMVLSAVLFKEKLTGIKVLSLVATFVGCVFVTGVIGSGESLSLPGILTGLGAGFGYALYSIFSRYALERGYHSFTISFYTFLVATIAVLPFTDCTGLYEVCCTSVGMFGFTILFGLVSTILPYIFYNFGLVHVENGKASIIASIEPVVATLFGVVLFKEKLTSNTVIGVILVLGAITICNLKIKKQQ